MRIPRRWYPGGRPFNSVLLAGGRHYDHAEAEPALRPKVERIAGVCQDHGVDIRAAVRQNAELLRAPIPAAFWRNLREIGVLPEDAPTPA